MPFMRRPKITNEFVGNAADTVSHTTDVAVNMTQRMADQGREAIWGGLRVAAGINGGLADVSYDNGHRILEQATRMMDIYGQTSERTTENLTGVVRRQSQPQPRRAADSAYVAQSAGPVHE